ncbi:MAG TPA: multicopper oxidase domain-containing protein [Anaeromyxobacteraceae bacterium]|nr:multicopper oxidase domain-containing protein [Anaeromyxobacteraceae bacterium]
MKIVSKVAAGASLAAVMVWSAPTPAQVWPYPGQVAGPAAPLDLPLDPATQPKFVNAMPQTVDFIPDQTTYPGWDYYEIAAAPVTGTAAFQSAGAPAGTQWLGLVDPVSGAKLYTPLWGYGQVNMGGGPLAGAATYPSLDFLATKGRPVKVKWVNNLPDQHLFCPDPMNFNWPCAIDRTLMGTKAGTGVGPYGGSQQPDNAMVVHFHGGEIPPESDGFAELWFGNAHTAAAYSPGGVAQPIDPPQSLAAGGTPLTMTRPVGNSMLYNYPMVNEASTLWFHDHALGKTRLDVAAGPAGFFTIIDPANEPANLPSGPYDQNIVIQDRAFNAPQPGSNLATINFPNGLNQTQIAPLPGQAPLTPGGNAGVHPQWVPEYFGDHSIVNGMAWPFMNVEPRKYRFHLLDGSNARCWALALSNGQTFIQVGTDQGYLAAPVPVAKLTLCPGERADVVIDFTKQKVGSTIVMTNNAPAPYPKGVSPTAKDVGKVMAFKVVALKAPDTSVVPATLVPVAPLAVAGAATREMVLNEVLDAMTLYPLRVQIDGKPFEGGITETPKKGATEVWKLINTTGDMHPIHLHLVKFQIVSRQKFDLNKYSKATGFAVPGNATFTKLPIAPYLIGQVAPPPANEAGWKDVVQTFPGEVTTIVANWDGKWNTTMADPDPLAGGAPAFLPVTSGLYVWHCHIVDHEDNEMMRPVMLQ